MDAIETIEHNGLKIEILIDDEPMDPRGDDNPTTMVCFHRDYKLGDKHDLESSDYAGPGELEAAILETYNVAALPNREPAIQPLFLIDHSGLSISTQTRFFRAIDSRGWDWGFVGYVFVTVEGAAMCGTTPDYFERVMDDDVNVYDQYLRGESYGYVISRQEKCDLGHTHDEVLDSCWGYLGDSDACLVDAKASSDTLVADAGRVVAE